MRKIVIIGVLLLSIFHGTTYCTVYTGTCGRVMAYPKVDSTNLLWQLNTLTRTLTITGAGQMRDYDSDTPAPWHQYRNDFDRVWVSDSATSIGEYAFWDLLADSIHIGSLVQEVRSHSMYNSYFQSLIFPAATKYIRSNAGYYNRHLKRLVFLNGAETLEYSAFSQCDSLQTVSFGSSDVTIGSSAFSSCSRLTSVTGTHVRYIDYYAFGNNTSLTNVQIGDYLQYLSENSFSHCSSLTRFVVPAATTTISGNPFQYCGAMDSLSVNSGNAYFDSRNGCNAIMRTSTNNLISGCYRTIIPNSCVSIGSSAFRGCILLDSITIPNSVHTIESYAFEGCIAIRNVTLSDSVTNVGCNTFQYCSSLQSPVLNSTLFVRLPVHYPGIYTMPSGIVRVVCGAFRSSDSLTSVVLPQSLRKIGDGAFQGCSRIDTITIPSRVNEMGTQAFDGCSRMVRITLPDSITLISWGLLQNCSRLRSIDIPDAVRDINAYAFNNCRSLQHVTIPANLQTIGAPFQGCDSLNSITWNARNCRWSEWSLNYYSIDQVYANRYYTSTAFYPVRHNIRTFVFGDSVQVVPRFLCYEMDNLTTLTIPANIDSIERGAFDYCNSVDTVNWNPRLCNSQISYIYAPFYTIRDNVAQFNFGDSVREIPAYLCHGMSNLHQLHIPSNVYSIGPYAFRYLNQLDTIWVDASNTHYDSRNQCNALLATSTDSLIIGCWKTEIPTDTRAIAPWAFRNVQRLTKVVVPEGVSYVGAEAFNGCHDLDSVTLPTRLARISDYSFQDCDNMRYLRMPDSLETIGMRAFANCGNLGTLSLASTLTSIDDYAFSNCTGLLDIYCNAVNPPTITGSSFVGSSCPIYVPCPEVENYRSAPVWSDISSRINGQYYLTFDARPNDYSYGDVIIVQEPSCANGAIVEAHPVVGYEFVGWVNQRDETMSTDTVYEFIPTENLVLTGVFQRLPAPSYNITLVVRPDDASHGSARIVMQPNFDILAEVSATPAAGYAFAAWVTENGDTLSRENTYIFDPQTIYNDDRDTVLIIATFTRANGIANGLDDGQPLKVWTSQQSVFVSVPCSDTYILYNINGVKVDAAYGNAGEVLRLDAGARGIYILRSKRYCIKVIVK